MVSQQISAATSPALEHPIRSRPKIPLMRPIVDEEMIQAATDALRNERLVMGESVFKFEEEFARYCGTRHAISTASGTAALQIGLQALGIGPGDSVITTPFTFIASSNAVLHAWARPEFADVEKTGFNLDPVEVGRKISKEIRAIVPVHLYGQPARMKEFRELASEHGTRLVEDACHAHGSEISGKRAGSMGDVGCFSFYTSKNMTVAGDGGMIVTDDDTVAETETSLRRSLRLTGSKAWSTIQSLHISKLPTDVSMATLKECSQSVRDLQAKFSASHYIPKCPTRMLTAFAKSSEIIRQASIDGL